MSALIGALRVTLGINTAAFERGLDIAQKRLNSTGRQMQRLGRNMSTYVTLPIVGIGAAGIKMAGDFEKAMNGVAIASQAPAKDFEKLKDLALDIGKSTIFGASQAAGAMEDLAKIGLSTEQILGGAARAAADLASAVGSELEPAAIAIADSMQQFNIGVEQLPTVVNQITGAVNQSKLSFEDYQLAIGQAGGAAGALGVSFQDFNATIASTSALFASGSDAGTSFKTFLTRLVPQTAAAAALMREYSLSFFDANGNMKSMAEIAENLRTSLGSLSEEAKTDVLKRVFGTDAMRTAIGLMDQGAAGIQNITAKIAEADAAAQSAQRMKGFNAQMKELGGAFETLAIRVADAGMLTALTGLVTAFAGLVSTLSGAHPLILQTVTVLAVLGAAAGPVIFVIGKLATVVAAIGPVATGLATAFTAVKAAMVAARIAALATLPALTPFLIPLAAIATAVTAVYLAWKHWDKIKAIVSSVYSAVKTWMWDKLNAVWDGVKKKVQAVGDWFKNLWSRVVGNSYIPDMVDGIAEHMARLDAAMVQPAVAAANKTAEAFRNLQMRVQGLLHQLFPEVSAGNQFLQDLKDLRDYAAQAGWSVDQLNAAIGRLQARQFGSNEPSIMGEELSVAPTLNMGAISSSIDTAFAKLPQIVDWTKAWNEQLKATAGQGLQSLADGLTAVIMGTANLGEVFRSVISQMLADLIRFQIQKAIVMGINGMFGSGAAAGMGLSLPGRAAGGPVMSGHPYIVGERGPELFLPGQSGSIVPNNKLGGAPVTINVNAPMSDRDARRTGSQLYAGWASEQARARSKGIA